MNNNNRCSHVDVSQFELIEKSDCECGFNPYDMIYHNLIKFREWQTLNWNDVYLYEDKLMIKTYLEDITNKNKQ